MEHRHNERAMLARDIHDVGSTDPETIAHELLRKGWKMGGPVITTFVSDHPPTWTEPLRLFNLAEPYGEK